MSEHRAFSLDVQGKTLTGTAIRYGETSHIAGVGPERFLAGAFQPLPGDIRLNLQHDVETLVSDQVELMDAAEELRMTAAVKEGSAAAELVRRGGLRGLSLSFIPLEENRSDGIRTISRAKITQLALVDRPAHTGSTVELRAGRHGSVNFKVRSGKKYGCRCAKKCTEAEFEEDSFAPLFDENTRPSNLIAGYGSSFVDRPIASTRRGTLSVRPDQGGIAGTILLPDDQVFSEMRAVDASTGLSVRPVIDIPHSSFREVGEVAVYSAVATRGIVIASTGEDKGWRDDYSLDAPDVEDRAAPDYHVHPAWAYLL